MLSGIAQNESKDLQKLMFFCHIAGLFLGPQMVGEALKGGRLIARLMEKEGYRVHPPTGMPAGHSFITAVEVGSRERMIAFCKAVQRASPVGSYFEPAPGESLYSFASATLIFYGQDLLEAFQQVGVCKERGVWEGHHSMLSRQPESCSQLTEQPCASVGHGLAISADRCMLIYFMV